MIKKYFQQNSLFDLQNNFIQLTINEFKSLIYVYCIQLLIYVKVFEHTFILKYYKDLYMRFHWLIKKYFIEINFFNVFKNQGRA